MAKLKSVPDDNTPTPHQRATTTSFRIPVVLYNKIKEITDKTGESLTTFYLKALTQYFGTFDEDSWATVTDAESYDPFRFYTFSQDKHGHSGTLHVPFPKPLLAEMAALASSGVVPAYRGANDIVRDAVYHRVKQIAQMVDAGELEVSVDMAMLMSDEMKIQNDAQEAANLIAAMKENAQGIYAREGTDGLRLYLAQREEDLDSIPAPFREEYQGVIETFKPKLEPKKRRRKK